MPRCDAGGGYGCEERRGREWSERVEKNEKRGGPFGLAEFLSDVAKIVVLTPVDDGGGNSRDITGENVTPDGRARDTDGDDHPWVELEGDSKETRRIQAGDAKMGTVSTARVARKTGTYGHMSWNLLA